MNKKSVLMTRDYKLPATDRVVKIVLTVIFAIYAAFLIFPFLWILINSFKNGWTEFSQSTWALPKTWMFSNYTKIFEIEDENFSVACMFGNSLILCLVCPTMSAISTTLAAYVMAKYKFVGQKFIYILFIIPMVVSIAGTTSSSVLLFDNLGFTEVPFLGVFLMSASGVGMGFLLEYAIFKQTSDTYMEAARIDGAGHLRIFFEIMLPHALGIIATLWIISFIGVWNDYSTPKLFLQDYYTVATGVQYIQKLVNGTDSVFRRNYPVFYASVIVTILPIIIVFLVFQKKIMNMSLGGGIK